MGTDLMGKDLESPTGGLGAVRSQKVIRTFESHQIDVQESFSRNPFLPDHDEVTVQQLPEGLNGGEGKTFFCQIQKLLNTNQPHFVFDCAKLRELDAVGIHLLLQCLEEVMKCNGDVKLAAVPPGPTTVLEATGVDSLFEIFDSTADAVQSFHYLPAQEWEMQAPLNASQTLADMSPAACGAD